MSNELKSDEGVTYLYFACDWIVNKEQVQVARMVQLIKASLELKIEMRIDFLPTPEGFFRIRFVARVEDRESLDEFVPQADEIWRLGNWFAVSEEYYQEISQFRSYAHKTLEELWHGDVGHPNIPKLLDTWYGLGMANEKLRELIQSNTEIYWVYSYLPNTELSYGWMLKLIGTFHRLGDIRKSRVKKNEDGLYIQEFVFRVFSQDELKRILDDTKAENFIACVPASEDDFLDATWLKPWHHDKYEQELNDLARKNLEIGNS